MNINVNTVNPTASPNKNISSNVVLACIKSNIPPIHTITYEIVHQLSQHDTLEQLNELKDMKNTKLLKINSKCLNEQISTN